ILEHLGQRRPRSVIEATGHTPLLPEIAGLPEQHGEIILLGTPAASRLDDEGAFFRAVFFRNLRVLGAVEWYTSVWPRAEVRHSRVRDLEAILAWIRDGRLTARGLITHHVTLCDLETAYLGLLNS